MELIVQFIVLIVHNLKLPEFKNRGISVPKMKALDLFLLYPQMKRVTHSNLQGTVVNDVIHLDADVTDVCVSGFFHVVQHPQESPAGRRVALHILSCSQQLPVQSETWFQT